MIVASNTKIDPLEVIAHLLLFLFLLFCLSSSLNSARYGLHGINRTQCWQSQSDGNVLIRIQGLSLICILLSLLSLCLGHSCRTVSAPSLSFSLSPS